jgi:hypothetical protein
MPAPAAWCPACTCFALSASPHQNEFRILAPFSSAINLGAYAQATPAKAAHFLEVKRLKTLVPGIVVAIHSMTR